MTAQQLYLGVLQTA